MNDLNYHVATICIVSIICTIFELISPDGSMKKIMNYILALFMLCCIIVPVITSLSTIELNFKKLLNFNSTTLQNKEIEDIRLDFTKQKINKLVDKTLNENGIKAKKIETEMYINDEEGISIDKTTIYISEQDKDLKPKIQGVMHRNLEIPCEIVIIQEN